MMYDCAIEKIHQELSRNLAKAPPVGHTGYWELDFAANRACLSRELRRLLALPPHLMHIAYNRFIETVDPADRPTVLATVEAMRNGTPHAELIFRVTLPGGTPRHLEAYARVAPGADGVPQRLFGTIRDVTERSLADHERQRTAARLEALFTSGHHHVAFLDTSFNYLRSSSSYGQRAGFSPEALAGRNHFALFPHPENEALFRQVVATGMPHTAEAQPLLHQFGPDRRVRYCSWSLHPVKDDAGQVTELLLCLADAADRRRVSRIISASERKYRALMDNAVDGIALVDLARRVIDANNRLLDMLGDARHELDSDTIFDLFAPDDAGRLHHALATVAQGGKLTEEFALRAARGGILPVEVSAALIDYGDDKAMLLSFRDISSSKMAVEALHQSEARSRAIVSHAGIGIKISGADGRLLETNRALQELLGYGHDELVALGWDVVAVADDDSDGGKLFSPLALWEGRIDSYRLQRRYRHKNGSLIWADCVTSVVHDERHRPLFSIEMITDVSEQHRIEEQRSRHERELNEARQAAEQASAAKTRFLAAASHDLRQPIQAIHLLVHVLMTSNLEPASAEIVSRIRSAIAGLGGMLDTLLDISKLEAALVVPEVTTFSLSPLMRQLADEFAPLAQEKGLEFAVIKSSATITSDRTLLARILRNLLSNAIRYTPRGRILFGCRRRAGALRIAVVDTGVGIAAEERHKIFHEFHQVGNQARDRREGLGLGLAIVDRLSRLLDHPVELSSRPGHGTLFAVTVPLTVASPPTFESTSQLLLTMDHPRSTVVIIDDEVDIREGLGMVLAQWGYRVFCGGSGTDAIKALADAEGAGPQLIIADYRLDGELGTEVIERVRRHFDCAAPGILLTGDTDPQRLVEADASGFVLLHKPVRPEELRRHIALSLAKPRHLPKRRR